MKMVTIKVEQRHIDNGDIADCDSCPLALAAREAGFPHANVMLDEWWPEGIAGDVFKLPSDASDFVYAVTRGETRLPATFELPLEGGDAGG